MLNDLETAGLAERHRDAVDRRRHIVAITGPGRAVLDEIEREGAKFEERLLAGLSLAEREQLAGLLLRISETEPFADRPDPCHETGGAAAIAACPTDEGCG